MEKPVFWKKPGGSALKNRGCRLPCLGIVGDVPANILQIFHDTSLSLSDFQLISLQLVGYESLELKSRYCTLYFGFNDHPLPHQFIDSK